MEGGGQQGTSDQRIHPRFKVEPKDLAISNIAEFELVDMSASGIAIRSNAPMKPGELLHVSLGSAIAVDTEVIACKMEVAPDEYTDGEFRIQCRFVEDLRGMELLVKTIQKN
jgi:hypothetical protein